MPDLRGREPSPSLADTLTDPNSILSPDFEGPPEPGAVGLPVGFSQLIRSVPEPQLEEVPGEPPLGWNLFAMALGTLAGTLSKDPKIAGNIMAGLVQRPLLLKKEAEERNRTKLEDYNKTRLALALKGLEQAMQTERAEIGFEARKAIEELKTLLKAPATEALIEKRLAGAEKARAETELLPGEAERKAADTASLIQAREEKAAVRRGELRQAEERLSLKHAEAKDEKVTPYFRVLNAMANQLATQLADGAREPRISFGGQEIIGAEAIRQALDRAAMTIAAGNQELAADLRAEAQSFVGSILDDFGG